RRFPEEGSPWPDGTYEAGAWVDHDPVGNSDIRGDVAVTVYGDPLQEDFTGTDTRQDRKAHPALGQHRGDAATQSPVSMDPTITRNEGFFNSSELVVPEGCVLNPTLGKTVAAGTHHPGCEVGEAICKALAQVLPERSAPQIYKLGMPTVIFGQHPDTGVV